MTDPDFVIPFENLPPRFVETIKGSPDIPAAARPAATIVLLRDAAEGMQVLLMRRNRKAGFVPGAYVFPGGRVDGGDASTAMMDRLDHLTHELAAERLTLHDAEPPAIAYYLAALREAFEETGILVGLRPDGSAPPTAAEDEAVDLVRDALMQDEISFADALERLECRIAGNAIEYIAHWITPLPEPRRYDTRFFAAKVGPSAHPIVDPREMTDAVWIEPGEALRRLDRGQLPMVFPTIKTIERLARFDSADAALDGFGARPIPAIMPTLVITPTGVGMQVDEDE